MRSKFLFPKDPLNFEPKLDNLLAYESNVVGSGDGRPTDAMIEAFLELDRRLQIQLDLLKALLSRVVTNSEAAAGLEPR